MSDRPKKVMIVANDNFDKMMLLLRKGIAYIPEQDEAATLSSQEYPKDSLEYLERLHKDSCSCGERALFFRLHSLDCLFFKVMLEKQEALEKGEAR